MFEFTERITVEAPTEQVWNLLVELEDWWPASNPDHQGLRFLGSREITAGTQVEIRERVAGVPGVAVGTITEVVEGEQVTWEAPAARYRLGPLTVPVQEGVTWRVEPTGSSSQLSAHVWAHLPDTIWGRIVEWAFVALWRGAARDREHARTELRYLKHRLEAASFT